MRASSTASAASPGSVRASTSGSLRNSPYSTNLFSPSTQCSMRSARVTSWLLVLGDDRLAVLAFDADAVPRHVAHRLVRHEQNLPGHVLAVDAVEQRLAVS